MLNLQTLPDELLLRILEELDAPSSPTPLHSLVLTSQRLRGFCTPLLYRSITINNVRQLKALANRTTSGAWRLAPEHSIKHLRINAAYINECEIFMGSQQFQEVRFEKVIGALADLVKSSSAGCLESLSIRIGPLKGFVGPQTEPPHQFFQYFLGIRARRIECTATHALPSYLNLGRSLWCDSDDLAVALADNPFLSYLMVPFLRLSPEGYKFVEVLRRKQHRVTLHLDWPVRLESADAAELLWELRDILDDKGLIIAAPASDIRIPEAPQYLYRHFRNWNRDLSPAAIQADLEAEELDTSQCMRKLEWRIEEYDLTGEEDNPDQGQQQIQPAIVASDGMWMDLSDDGEYQQAAGGAGGWVSSLTELVSGLWTGS